MLRRLARGGGAAARSASLSSAAERSGLIAAACILERLPLVMPPPPVWEIEYQAWREKKQAGTFKTYPKELVEPKQLEEESSKQSWAPAALQGMTDSLRSPERKAQDFVYLLVRKSAGEPWHFPVAPHRSGETIRETGMRALSETAAGLDVHFVGNAPGFHLGGADGCTVFFMRACYLGGNVKPASHDSFAEYAWVAKSEVADFLAPELHELARKALS